MPVYFASSWHRDCFISFLFCWEFCSCNRMLICSFAQFVGACSHWHPQARFGGQRPPGPALGQEIGPRPWQLPAWLRFLGCDATIDFYCLTTPSPPPTSPAPPASSCRTHGRKCPVSYWPGNGPTGWLPCGHPRPGRSIGWRLYGVSCVRSDFPADRSGAKSS